MSDERFAADVPDLELGDYQRAVRLLLRHPLVTAAWPDEKALPRVRRFAGTLGRDLAAAFDYRLELHGNTARLLRTRDAVDPTNPALSRTGRPFDRQRYAYLSLCLAALGRSGIQTTLTELADVVAADANRITGLGLDPDRGGDRRAFVDAVGWLEERGALSVADGSAAAWASDPEAGEALYDVARDVVLALFRPARVVQHVASVTALLHRPTAKSRDTERLAAAQAARRAVVESSVVYFADVEPRVTNHLRGNAIAGDLQRLTGLRVERRAEGLLLVDTAALSQERFPGTGTVAQAALLLAVAMAERAADPDRRRVRRLEPPDRLEAQRRLVAGIDIGLPTATRVSPPDEPAAGGAEPPLGAEPPPGERDAADPRGDAGDDSPGRLPFVTDSFLRQATVDLLERFRPAFGSQWHADPDRLCAEAIDLLERFRAVLRVPGGVLVRPLVGRYRDTVAQVRHRLSGSPEGEPLRAASLF
jgi:uncharacterized protein (TIGR02678 family)